MNERINKFLQRKIDLKTMTISKPQAYSQITASQSFGDIKTVYVGKQKIVYLGDKTIYDELKYEKNVNTKIK